MNEWQPIETAPRDGTKFLISTIYDESGEGKIRETAIGRWSNFSEKYPISVFGLRLEKMNWTTVIKSDDKGTFWMHLPAPPIVTAA